ncbi:MAG: NAD(P)/FAD-dependent oxidoreductase [Methyloglobulus sp.]|nr:NAD(P)/FAD-dependent oxidoreductase [Methyloglobulus sp.]
MDVWGDSYTIGKWQDLIVETLESGDSTPIFNINPKDTREFDAIFLGGGAAGRFGAAYLRALGGRVLIIDRWPFLGGSCPHQACVPHHLFSDCAAQLMLERTFSSKLWFQNLEDKIVSIKNIVDLFRNGRTGPHAVMNYQSKEQLGLEFVLNAESEIIDANTVKIGKRKYQAKNLVLALGAKPLVADIPGASLKGVFNSLTLVEKLDYEPGNTIVVIGGGKSAIEYGCFFNATGRRTLVIARHQLMPMLKDAESRSYAILMMEEQGMEFLEYAEISNIQGDLQGKVKSVSIRTADGTINVDTDFVFMGLGEQANSEMIAQKLALETGEKGFIKINRHMQTSVHNVYAVGDVTGSPMEMFKARKEGVCAAKNIMGQTSEYKAADYPDFMHTHYEVCWLGLSEEEARQRHANVKVMKLPPDNPNGLDVGLPAGDRMMLYLMAKPRMSGFQKLIIDGDTRKILGAFHIGYGAKDGFQYLNFLVKKGLTIDDLADMDELFISPSYFIQLCRLRAGDPHFNNM